MISEEEIRRQVVTTIAEEFELDPALLVPTATLYDDLGLDSLDAVDLVVAMEKTFAIKLANEEAVRAARTMDDLFQLVISTKNRS